MNECMQETDERVCLLHAKPNRMRVEMHGFDKVIVSRSDNKNNALRTTCTRSCCSSAAHPCALAICQQIDCHSQSHTNIFSWHQRCNSDLLPGLMLSVLERIGWSLLLHSVVGDGRTLTTHHHTGRGSGTAAKAHAGSGAAAVPTID